MSKDLSPLTIRDLHDYDYVEVFLLLKNSLKSTKIISLNKEDNEVFIHNYIDGSEEYLTIEEFKQSNLFKNIERGNVFFVEGWKAE